MLIRASFNKGLAQCKLAIAAPACMRARDRTRTKEEQIAEMSRKLSIIFATNSNQGRRLCLA